LIDYWLLAIGGILLYELQELYKLYKPYKLYNQDPSPALPSRGEEGIQLNIRRIPEGGVREITSFTKLITLLSDSMPGLRFTQPYKP